MTTIRYVHANTPEDIDRLMKQAIDNRLYVPGWMFREIFQSQLDRGFYSVKSATVAYDELEPIGVSVAWSEASGRSQWGNHEKTIGCFVKPEYRGKKVGSGLLAETLEGNYNHNYGEGIKGSTSFFRKNIDEKAYEALYKDSIAA